MHSTCHCQQFGQVIPVEERKRFYFDVFQDMDLLFSFNESNIEFVPFKFSAFQLEVEKFDAFPAPVNANYPSQQLIAMFQVFIHNFESNEAMKKPMIDHVLPFTSNPAIDLRCYYRIQDGLINIFRDSIQMYLFNGTQFVDTFNRDNTFLQFTNLQFGSIVTFGLFATPFQPQLGENILAQYSSKFQFSVPPQELSQSWQISFPNNNQNPSYFALQRQVPSQDQVPQGYVVVSAVKYIPSQPSPNIEMWDWRFQFNSLLGFQDVSSNKMTAIDPFTLQCACGEEEGKALHITTTDNTLSNSTVYCLMGNLCRVMAIVAKPSKLNELKVATHSSSLKMQEGSLRPLRGMNYYQLTVENSKVAIVVQVKTFSSEGKLYVRKGAIPSPYFSDDFLSFRNANVPKTLVLINDDEDDEHVELHAPVVYYLVIEHVFASTSEESTFDYSIGAFLIQNGTFNPSNREQLTEAQRVGIAFGMTVLFMLVLCAAAVIVVLVYCLRRVGSKKSIYLNM
ncbi:hypothetical protein FDP41_011329 [Naegleria fowleri]|uniref:Uncharacterized protein n=1 Tax=Naegleria fowleri TaxID=5763 RepID=A0A6A5CAW8_NAEFO|nr:uncharacterized protein FDP41_011329 [Naegleria fowleri]KAF0982399.1 hypothetical protein FDP41_011329 [Naegleria fowleri]